MPDGIGTRFCKVCKAETNTRTEYMDIEGDFEHLRVYTFRCLVCGYEREKQIELPKLVQA